MLIYCTLWSDLLNNYCISCIGSEGFKSLWKIMWDQWKVHNLNTFFARLKEYAEFNLAT